MWCSRPLFFFCLFALYISLEKQNSEDVTFFFLLLTFTFLLFEPVWPFFLLLFYLFPFTLHLFFFYMYTCAGCTLSLQYIDLL